MLRCIGIRTSDKFPNRSFLTRRTRLHLFMLGRKALTDVLTYWRNASRLADDGLVKQAFELLLVALALHSPTAACRKELVGIGAKSDKARKKVSWLKCVQCRLRVLVERLKWWSARFRSRDRGRFASKFKLA